MSTTWKVLPSDILHISDEFAAYQLNRAVFYWGKTVEGAVREVGDKAKNSQEAKAKASRVLDNWLSDSDEIDPKKFKSPGV